MKRNAQELRNKSPVKRQVTLADKTPKDDKPEEKKKPKPEMKDAQTQTDRCDYQQIKAKWLKEQALKAQKAQQEANAALVEKKAQLAGQMTEGQQMHG